MILHLMLVLPTAAPYRYLPKDEVRPYDLTAPTNFHILQANAMVLPFQALVVYDGLYCSASLVASRVVVTAASCFHQYHSNMKPLVKVGGDTITDTGEVIEVNDVKIHEYFQHTSMADNDIAMLILKEHVKFGPKVEKILLVDPDTALRVGAGVTVSGWGSTKLGPENKNKLLLTQMIVMDRQQCKDIYGGLITNSNFCAAYDPEGRLSDNGGPATHEDLLVGILSFGANRKVKPNVAVFTNVSYFHRWIVMNVKRYLKKYCVLESYEYE